MRKFKYFGSRLVYPRHALKLVRCSSFSPFHPDRMCRKSYQHTRNVPPALECTPLIVPNSKTRSSEVPLPVHWLSEGPECSIVCDQGIRSPVPHDVNAL